MLGGMIMNMVALLEKGIPLRMTSTVSSKVLGATRVSGKSENHVYSVELVELPAEWCVLDFTPEGVEVQDIDAQIEQALAGAGAGSQQDMQQMNEAMQQLTPEQREAMSGVLSGMGLEGMIPGRQMPGGQSQAAPARAARSGPSSADLSTDDLTQTAQLHLEALGYEVGNTRGDLDTNTIIAISQFQAENGMKVTGEISPQLVGILSAEVDRQR